MIRSPRNSTVAQAARLLRATERRQRGQMLVEGPHLLEEILAASLRPAVVFALPDDSDTARVSDEWGIDMVQVDERGLRRLTDSRNPRGPVAVVDIPQRPLRGGHLLVAWGVSDPGNVGALIRTAAAYDWDFAYTEGTSDPWSPKTMRAGAGGHFRIGVRMLGEDPLDTVRRMGLETVASVVGGGTSPESLTATKVALLVGDEGSGIPAEVAAAAARRVTVPMPGGTESLNVAVAAGIILHAISGRSGRTQTGV